MTVAVQRTSNHTATCK